MWVNREHCIHKRKIVDVVGIVRGVEPNNSQRFCFQVNTDASECIPHALKLVRDQITKLSGSFPEIDLLAESFASNSTP